MQAADPPPRLALTIPRASPVQRACASHRHRHPRRRRQPSCFPGRSVEMSREARAQGEFFQPVVDRTGHLVLPRSAAPGTDRDPQKKTGQSGRQRSEQIVWYQAGAILKPVAPASFQRPSLLHAITRNRFGLAQGPSKRLPAGVRFLPLGISTIQLVTETYSLRSPKLSAVYPIWRFA